MIRKANRDTLSSAIDFGSVCHRDDKSVVNLTRAYFADKDLRTARKVFHDNAVRFYGIVDHEAE